MPNTNFPKTLRKTATNIGHYMLSSYCCKAEQSLKEKDQGKKCDQCSHTIQKIYHYYSLFVCTAFMSLCCFLCNFIINVNFTGTQ